MAGGTSGGTAGLGRLLLETVEGGVLFAVDPEGRICLWSRGAELLTGWSSEEVLGQPLSWLHPHDSAGEEVGWWRRRDGSRFQAEESFTALRGADGRLRGFGIRLLPVDGAHATERDRAEAAERRTRAILERITDAFAALDRRWRFTFVNREAERLSRRPRPALEGHDIWEALPGLADMPLGHQLRRAMAEQQPLHFEEYLPRTGIWVSAHVYPSDEGLSVFMRDITERKRAEEAQRESERFLKGTLDALSAHVVILDERGTILAANAAWLRFARENGGAPERTGPGVNYLEVCDRASAGGNLDGAQAARGIREVLAGTREAFELEYSCHSATERRWFTLRVTRFAGPGPTRGVVAHEQITARKLAEEAERASEARFRAVFEHAGIGMGLVDTRGRLLETNRALRAMLGYSEEEVRGRLAMEFAHPAELLESTPLFEETLAGQRDGYALERRFRHKDGHLVWCRFTLSLVRGEGGAPLYAIAMVEDITARRAATATTLRLGREEAARVEAESARARIATILESIAEPFLALDRQRRFTFANRRAAEALGVPPESLLGRRWDEALPHLADTRLAHEVARATRDQVAVHFEEFLFPLHGFFEAHLSPSGGGLSIYLRDISERRRAEDAQRLLAEAGPVLGASLDYEATLNALVRLIVPRLADWSVVLMLEGEEARPMALAHRDPEQEPMLARLKHFWLGPEESSAGLQRVLRTGRSELVSEVTDAWLRENLGSEESLRLARELAPRSLMHVGLVARGRTLGALSFASRQPGRYGPYELALAEDLAGRAALAIDNARLYHESQQASRMRDEVLAVVSHDLRNPLNAIQLSAGLLRKKICPTQTAPGYQQVDIIQRSSQRAVRLIQDLLEVGRIQAGRLRVERARLEPARLVDDALELHRGLVEARGLKLEREVEEPLPAVLADRERVAQVLSNLIGNAMKATAPGGRIALGARAHEDGRVCLWVRDTGKGIPPEDLPRLFDWLWQAKGTREGVGLGLYISKGIVEAHGGRIWVESKPGEGATFSFTLQVAAES